MEDTIELEALFEFATEGIVVTDREGTIKRINPAGLRMFGYGKAELLGRKVEILIPDHLGKKHQSHRSEFHKNPHSRSMGIGMNLLGKKKDGSHLPVEISLSPYKTEEGVFVIAFIIDITLRKEAEDKLRDHASELEKEVQKRTMILQEAVAQLESTKEELSESLEKEKELGELKSRFVAMASHEFRTPLATILSSLSLLDKYSERGEREKQQKHISRIKGSISALTDILNDILSLSKLEEGGINPSLEEENIPALIKHIIADMNPLMKSGQEMTYEHKGSMDTWRTDRKILKNILFNLLSNAIKFSTEGKKISVRSEITGRSFSISVQDQGIGISKEDQVHLFERFFRGKNATNIQGTGLGLNILLKYAELLNGNVSVESELGKGTMFNIQF